MKRILSGIVFFLIGTASLGFADFTIPTTVEQDAMVAEAAAYEGYTNVNTYVAMRGLEEIKKTAENIKRKRSNILSDILYLDIGTEDRITLEQLADKYKK